MRMPAARRVTRRVRSRSGVLRRSSRPCRIAGWAAVVRRPSIVRRRSAEVVIRSRPIHVVRRRPVEIVVCGWPIEVIIRAGAVKVVIRTRSIEVVGIRRT